MKKNEKKIRKSDSASKNIFFSIFISIFLHKIMSKCFQIISSTTLLILIQSI